MAVKLRLARRGSTHRPFYSIVAASAKAPRDGRYIEKLGTHDPKTQPATVELKEEAIVSWLLKGAQPTKTVRDIFSSQGVMFQAHLQVGVRKGAIMQQSADQQLAAWKVEKSKKKGGTYASVPKPSSDATHKQEPVVVSPAKKSTAVPKPKQTATTAKEKSIAIPKEVQQEPVASQEGQVTYPQQTKEGEQAQEPVVASAEKKSTTTP